MFRNNLTSVKAVNSWKALFEAAIRLFQEKGYQETTIRMIAKEAGCSLGSFYKYFSSKEEIIIALYERISNDLENVMQDLPEGKVGHRFSFVMQRKMELIAPYEPLFATITGYMLDANHAIGVVGKETEIIRLRNLAMFKALVEGAKDKPRLKAKRQQLIKSLYGVHLLFLFLGFLDKSEGKANTHRTLEKTQSLLNAINVTGINPVAGYIFGMMDDAFSNVLNISVQDSNSELAHKVLELIFQHRKSMGSEKCLRKPCGQCFAMHIDKVDHFISQGQPIHFVLPAFPAKSPNMDKVLGKLPDLGEELALQNLQLICNKIQDIYEPGAKITICADGRVFSDLVLVDDPDVTAYTDQLRSIIASNDLHSLEVMNLEDFIKAEDFDGARQRLIDQHAKPLEQFQARISDSEYHEKMFNGIHRFISDDQVGFFPELSKTQFKKYTKEVALKVMQRSDAWGAMLNDFYPLSVRLSIHPHHPHSNKIGINLTKAEDNWITPWHGAIVLKPKEGYVLGKKAEALARGARIIQRNTQPHYLSLSPEP